MANLGYSLAVRLWRFRHNAELAGMQAGQPVTIRIDFFPELRPRGHVDSFQHGTGSNFALLPPENDTGNFVKVVQRIPVKIVLDDAPEAIQSISPGMSVEPTVTKASRPCGCGPSLPWSARYRGDARQLGNPLDRNTQRSPRGSRSYFADVRCFLLISSPVQAAKRQCGLAERVRVSGSRASAKS
jgi:hypothetical protein